MIDTGPTLLNSPMHNIDLVGRGFRMERPHSQTGAVSRLVSQKTSTCKFQMSILDDGPVARERFESLASLQPFSGRTNQFLPELPPSPIQDRESSYGFAEKPQRMLKGTRRDTVI